jgi:predicted Zn-dependent protease with MMP-like domain
VREELYQQWDMDDEGFSEQVNRRVIHVTEKAWRFEGEMKEIAGTFQAQGLPPELHNAMAEIYQRISKFKDAAEIPSLEEVLRLLLAQ